MSRRLAAFHEAQSRIQASNAEARKRADTVRGERGDPTASARHDYDDRERS